MGKPVTEFDRLRDRRGPVASVGCIWVHEGDGNAGMRLLAV